MTFDGFGRLQTVHRPEQQPQPNNTASSDHTTFYYNLDDTVAFTIDARGVKKSFSYNERHFVTSISYDLSLIPPAQNFVVPTANQTFTYDAAGNRTSVSDSTGTVTYQYNSLSQLNSETRTFAGPFSGTSFTLIYGYNLSGEIQSLTLPSQFGTSLTYNHDTVGRLTGVTGTGYSYTDSSNSQVPVSSFMANALYRAWNDLKQMNTGSLSQTSFTYDQQLRPTSYNVTAGSLAYTWNYAYYADGKVKMVSDLANDHFDKAYAYDHVGRMTEAYSGREARGLPATTPTPDSPYRQSFSYSAFNQHLGETGRIWQLPLSGQVFSYTNNRRQDLLYDAMGHVTADAQGNHVFDAAGERVLVTAGSVGGGETGHAEMSAEERAVSYDADGQPVKSVTTTRTETLVGNGPQTWISEDVETIYYLRSTALGGYVVGELNAQGQKTRQYVYAGGERLVEQRTIGGYTTINWQHRNPLTDSWVSVDPNQSFSFRTEVDAHGRETGLEPFTILPNEPPPPETRSPSYLEIEGGQTIEAELGMQLYEDFFLNGIYKGGHGPATGGYDRLRTERESQLRAGGTFLFGQDRQIATAFGEYEEIGFGVGLQYIRPSEIPPRPASWRPVTLKYYQLKPGLGGRKKTADFSHSVKEPQNPTVGEDIKPRNLLANIFHLLDDNRCFTFVSNIINVARQLTGLEPYTYDGKELAVAVARQENGGFIFRPGANGGGGAGSAYGDIFSGAATAEIVMFNTAYGPRHPVGVQVSYALTALHEIIHLAGGGASAYDGSRAYYTDVVLADAARILTGAPGYPEGYNRNMPWWQITADMTAAAGVYWNKQLQEHCTPQEYR